MSTILPQAIGFFQPNRKQKRSYGQTQIQEKYTASQIISVPMEMISSGKSKQPNGISQIVVGSKENFMIGLTKIGQIYVWGKFSIPIPNEDGKQTEQIMIDEYTLLSMCQPQHFSYFKNVKINQIACSDTVALFLSNEGTVYGWGDDSDQKHGILGLGAQYKAVRPCPNSQLFDYMVKSISLSETHACAVDSTGRLFCWGYGPYGQLGIENCNLTINVPTMVTKQKQINIKKALAHHTYTAFCSSAGYVYLYGTLHPQFQKSQLATSRSGIPTQSSIARTNSQSAFDQSKQGNINAQQTNRPLTSMTQIISLSENFFCDLACGESFLIGLTSNGDVFFVDDSLESLQINSYPIESIAVAGSKILGLVKPDRLIEWSTAGLNKLSFNKENKLLLKQDFQIKEYQIKPQYASNFSLQNLALLRNTIGVVFEDVQNMSAYFKSTLDKQEDVVQVQDESLVIAEIIPHSIKQNHFNPCADSSMDSSKDQIVEQRDENEEVKQENLNNSEDSFQNNTIPEISVADNPHNFNNADNSSFRLVTEEKHIIDITQPSQFMNEKDINNIFNYNNQPTVKSNNLISTGQFGSANQENEKRKSNLISKNVCQNSNIFFFENLNQNDQTGANNTRYRPSSIKSFKQDYKSDNNNSSPSLKFCAEQMMPLSRNSKISISYPSFLNMSGDNKEQNFHDLNDGCSLDIGIPQISEVNNNNFQQQFNSNQIEDEEVRESDMRQFEFSIQVLPQASQSHSESGSREASIVSRVRRNQEDNSIEESMIITVDSFKIKAKRTTTPRRLLHSYSRRSQASESQSENHNPMNQSQQTDIKSQSELSNGFNITTNSITLKDQSNRPTMNNENLSRFYQRPSNLINLQDQTLLNRPSLGNQINQTDENFEVEYTISQSCTPDSRQSSSHIKRRINFDDASGETGGVIRYSDVNNATKFITSFTLNMNQNQPEISILNQNKQTKIQNNNSKTSQKNKNDQSTSFIFNQCQSPVQQPFIQENPMSNIKSATTPSHQGNSTHLMMLTEEKFKNLKTEISQQQEPQGMNQFLITQNTLLSSPLMNDFNNFTKDQTRSYNFGIIQNNSMSIQNLSSFIKNSKYLQVYENFRRGFHLLERLKHQKMLYTVRKIKRVAADKKQKQEFLQNFARFLVNTLKSHIQEQKHFGFKRIKKFYKERQLQQYIYKKQNEYAMKASTLVKIDQIIHNHNIQQNKEAFKQLFAYYQSIKQMMFEKKKRGLQQIGTVINRKNKSILESSMRSMKNWVSEKKIIEMNLKIISRIITKITLNQKIRYFKFLRATIESDQKKKKALGDLIQQMKLKAFKRFSEHSKIRGKMIEGLLRLSYSHTLFHQKISQIEALLKWRGELIIASKINNMIEIYERCQQHSLRTTFKQYVNMIEKAKQQEKQTQLMKAMIALFCNKVDEIKRRNLMSGFMNLKLFCTKPEETYMIYKSNTMSNLSFNFVNNSEISLVLNNRKESKLNAANVLDQSLQGKQFKTHDQVQSKKLDKSKRLVDINKKNYLTNKQNPNDKQKLALNDYLSFSPHQQQIQKQQQFQFQQRRNTDSQAQTARNYTQLQVRQEDSSDNKVQKSYLDCPIPISSYQEKMKSKQARMFSERSQKNPPTNNETNRKNNPLNVSIKEMNQAFRDQISRIKERQDEQNLSYMSSHYNNMTNQECSFEQKKLFEIEFSQTPEQFVNLSNDQLIMKQLHRGKENTSPKINPLCTSESQHILYGMKSNIQQHYNQNEELNYKASVFNHTINPMSMNYNSKELSTHSQQFGHISAYQTENHIMKHQIQHYSRNEYNSVPKSSTFGQDQLMGLQGTNENVNNSGEKSLKPIKTSIASVNSQKENNINNSYYSNKVQRDHDNNQSSSYDQAQQQCFSGSASSEVRKKSDTRYNNQQQKESMIEQDYSLDFEQNHDMFDEFDHEEQEQKLVKHQTINNVGTSYVKSSIADLSKKIHLTHITQTESQDSQDLIDIGKHRTLNHQQMKDSQSNPYLTFQEVINQNMSRRLTNDKKVSPLQIDESFIPSGLNRELLNELAANFQMMELTPETDYKMMMLNNKSLFNRQESVYSNNNYADPIEMTISPRGVCNDISAIGPQQNTTTNQTQFNFYGNDETGRKKTDVEELDCELSDMIENGRDSRPYDFELSSNSKFKIISENLQAKAFISSQAVQPSMIMQHNNICKKLTFGYDNAKKDNNKIPIRNNNNQSKQQKSTFLLSGGEQTINFNLTQDDEEEDLNNIQEKNHKIYSDEEMEVGEENPVEQTQKLNLALPESRILQQELQEEKSNITLTHADLMAITSNRMHKLNSMNPVSGGYSSRNNYQPERKSPQTARDFISSNIEKLKQIVKSPINQNNYYQNLPSSTSYQTQMNSNNFSTRNISQRSFGLFNSRTNPKNSTQQASMQEIIGKEVTNLYTKGTSAVSRSHAFSNTMKPEGSLKRNTSRNYSKENHPQRDSSSSHYKLQGCAVGPQVLKEKSNPSNRRNPTNYQPMTFRMPSTQGFQNSFGNGSINGSIMQEKRISYDHSNMGGSALPSMQYDQNKNGSYSYRSGSNIPVQKSRNVSSNQMQACNQSGNYSLNKGNSMYQSKNNSQVNLRQFQ